jgi:hypothetical protein
MVLIDKPPESPPGKELTILQRASAFLQKHEMKLIRLQAIKDSYVERFGEEAYQKKDEAAPDYSKEFLAAGRIILELIGMIAAIQAERISDLTNVLDEEEDS